MAQKLFSDDNYWKCKLFCRSRVFWFCFALFCFCFCCFLCVFILFLQPVCNYKESQLFIFFVWGLHGRVRGLDDCVLTGAVVCLSSFLWKTAVTFMAIVYFLCLPEPGEGDRTSGQISGCGSQCCQQSGGKDQVWWYAEIQDPVRWRSHERAFRWRERQWIHFQERYVT